jgi:hypothetical protein
MKDVDFEIEKNCSRYLENYIIIGKSFNKYYYDKGTAKLLNIFIDDYKTIMKNKFNAKLSSYNQVFFKTKKDAKKALEWIESKYLIIKLKRG